MENLFMTEASAAWTQTAIALICYLALLIAFSWLFPLLKKRVRDLHSSKIKSLSFRNFEFISADAIIDTLCQSIGLLRVIATVIVTYFFFSIVFSFFPTTQELSHNMLDYFVDPFSQIALTVIGYVPKAIYILVIFLVVRYLLKVIRLFFVRIERGQLEIEGFYQDWAKPTYNIVRILVFAFTLIIIFPHLPGASTPAFQGISVFLGLLISLGSSSAISNLVSGIVITYMRPFQVGDRVQINETVGDVVEKSLLVTRIRTIKNVDITIPNSAVLNSHMKNFSAVAQDQGLILNTRITIGYEVRWEIVHKLLLEAAQRTEGLIPESKPFIFQTKLDNSYVEYELNAYTRLANQFDNIYSDLHRHIHDVFNAAKVEILSPSYFSMRDGNKPTA